MYPHQGATSTVLQMLYAVQQQMHSNTLSSEQKQFSICKNQTKHNNNPNSFSEFHHDLGCDFEMDPARKRSALNVEHPRPARERAAAVSSIRVSLDLLVLPLLLCR